VIVRHTPDGRREELIQPPFNARTRVHEYGGGSYTVKNGSIYFANYDDQRLYRQEPGGQPEPLTPPGAMRYADLEIDLFHRRLICIREDHSGEGEAVNTLVAVSLNHMDEGRILASGDDFYASPRLSIDGRRLAWLTWNHPNMPWDGCELWVAEIAGDGSITGEKQIAGGAAESIFQPEWTATGDLIYISDRTDWWNLYRDAGENPEALYPMEAEFGVPQWNFGLSTYALIGADKVVCSYLEKGLSKLATLDLSTRLFTPLNLPYTAIGSVRSSGRRVAFIGAQPTEYAAVVEMNLETNQATTLHKAGQFSVDSEYLSRPKPIDFPTEGGEVSHAFYYPPRNGEYQAPDGELPPLIVSCHGGPTSTARAILDLSIQFWTSRGFAFLSVNHGGSSGFGRRYRERLIGQWGLIDVIDCVNGARYLANQELADLSRIVIRGGSAGGFTTLCALVFTRFFQAGASYFGVSDLEALANDTHKFESRYLDSLIGPYPQRIDLYRQRSPIHFTNQISSPLIMFQGLEDPVVPPNQAEAILETMRRNGQPVAYLPFEGEKHGFRKAENIKRALDAELSFYSQIFEFEIADDIEPVHIENLESKEMNRPYNST